jgi:hypothetical protein
MPEPGIVCQSCGIEAPVKYFDFYQNIGMLVARRWKRVKGNLCRRCVHRHFWSMTSTTLAVGWLGTISICVTPFILLNNIFRYFGVVGMPPVPPGAVPPILDAEAVRKLQPQANEIVRRLNNKDPLLVVARDIGPRVGVTPGQVMKYVIALSQAARQPAAPPSMPVVPLPSGEQELPKGDIAD